MYFDVIEVSEEARVATEPLGTKEKFWYRDNEERVLFKIGRENTGEDWAEKIACELCRLIGLPHAKYEFAVWKENRGVVSPSIVPANADLVLGNVILTAMDRTYPGNRYYRVRQHNLKNVLRFVSIRNINLPIGFEGETGIETALDVFMGYLILDAWIANTDRHHENWGVIVTDSKVYLSPTFDHASSMGRNESDKIRREKLQSNDENRSTEGYARRAKSAFYSSNTKGVKLNTFEVVKIASSACPMACETWIKRIADIPNEMIRDQFSRIPKDRISELGIDFAVKLLDVNRKRLLKEVENIT